jgi:aryl-alcohol dehydrogenase-like predicted oxidoreductase
MATPKATYRRLGTSGLLVSVPILGTMGIGTKSYLNQSWIIEEEEALPLFKAAYDRGVTTWDTSNSYSHGVSELIIGRALKKYDIPRHKVIIMTKCCKVVRESNEERGEFKGTREYVNQYGLSRAPIFNAVDASLSRLGTEYIDVLQIHRFDPDTPIAETMKALHDLVESGKVRYLGASSMYCYQFAMMQFCALQKGWTSFVSMQGHYSLLYREEEREMKRFCDETGVGLIPWGPLNGGRLSKRVGERTSARSQGHVLEGRDGEIVERVAEVAERKGCTMSQVALKWIMGRVSSPIVGITSVERLDEAIGAVDVELSEEEVKWLEELYEPKAIKGHSSGP